MDVFNNFVTAVQQRTDQLGVFALAQYDLRKKEQAMLFEAMEEGINENRKIGSDMVDDFLKQKQKVCFYIYLFDSLLFGLRIWFLH